MKSAKNNQQKTLLQFWKSNSGLEQNEGRATSSGLVSEPSATANHAHCTTIEDDDDGDDIALIEASDRFMNETYKSLADQATEKEGLTIGLDDQTLQNTQFIDCDGFDKNSGAIWIYPTNFPIREYQLHIVEQCLFKNTMVVLPTGMGKTFIAAVVMFNFYRWYPSGKVIFMAPTRPLVLQQAQACFKIMGIPKDDVIQMTGQMQPNDRKIKWSTKRVFFLTPQVLSNDIEKGNVSIENFKCIVIDEAHKALGDYAFCKVIESVKSVAKNFRVVALTATPGSDLHVS
jgi:superfamily II DNA or RNA helicase